MENIFEKGNKITTNRLNCFEVVDINKNQVVCRDLLTDEFFIFSKTEHKFENANIKLILELSLKKILDETEMSDKDKKHVLLEMGNRIFNWL